MSIIYTPKGKALEYAPLAANLFNGCSHGCDYCYAPAMLRMDKEQFWNNPQPKKDVLSRLEKQLCSGRYGGKRVMLSFTSDPYHNQEAADFTRAALELFIKYSVNWNVLTKNKEARRDFHLYRGGDKFGMTLTFRSNEDSMSHEPKASLPIDRMVTLKMAHEARIPTWVSMEPVIDPSQTLKLIELTREFVDFYKVGKINYQKTSVDWVKFRTEAIALLEQHGKKYYIKKDLREILY